MEIKRFVKMSKTVAGKSRLNTIERGAKAEKAAKKRTN